MYTNMCMYTYTQISFQPEQLLFHLFPCKIWTKSAAALKKEKATNHKSRCFVLKSHLIFINMQVIHAHWQNGEIEKLVNKITVTS